VEHKAVAFDVYRAAGGSERRRIWTMRWMTVSFLAGVTGHAIVAARTLDRGPVRRAGPTR
jgi:predicted metal-dependent hydrolase